MFCDYDANDMRSNCRNWEKRCVTLLGDGWCNIEASSILRVGDMYSRGQRIALLKALRKALKERNLSFWYQ